MEGDRNSSEESAIEPPGSIELRYEIGADEVPSTALAVALSAVKGVGPVEMSPLYGRVDLEALDALLASTRESGCSTLISLESHDVIVDGGEVVVSRRDGSDRREIPPEP